MIFKKYNTDDKKLTQMNPLTRTKLVDALDYGAFDIKYSGAGHPAYHPRVPLKLLIMGGLDRVRSARRLARNARENVVYMYLGERSHPQVLKPGVFWSCL
jgi:transposase